MMIIKKASENAPKAIGPYSQSVMVNNVLYTSGQIPINPKTNEVVDGDIINQTTQVCENLKAVLNVYGLDFNNVIKTTCFLNDMADFASFNSVYEKYFTSLPARSCVAVKTLPKNVLVEIELIAYDDKQN